jgi:epoxyqueuosine reductase
VSDAPHTSLRAPTWEQKRAWWDARRRQPDSLAALADRLRTLGAANGLAAVGITDAEPFVDARAQIQQRITRGFAADMGFTFRNPQRATTPADLLPDAASIVVAALPYRFADPNTEAYLEGAVAKYQWTDFYGELKSSLSILAAELKREGWRARVLADDNVLVDRAAAHRAGIGWFGKNANLLLPGLGSWFVLGSVVSDAPLPTNTEPVPDGCGTCSRCIPGCPTAAIVEPGVIDARRCLAWLLQSPEDIPEFARLAMGSRVYGCDDCQEVCPENRLADRRTAPAEAPANAVNAVDLRAMVNATDEELLHTYGRWWLPDRNPDVLRRNAVVGLGNVGDPGDVDLRALLDAVRMSGSSSVVSHATWAVARLDERRRNPRVE